MLLNMQKNKSKHFVLLYFQGFPLKICNCWTETHGQYENLAFL